MVKFSRVAGNALFAMARAPPIFRTMKRFLSAIAALIATIPLQASAADGTAPDLSQVIVEASEVTLEDFLWLKRPVVVFADTAADPRFVQQMQYLTRELEEMEERDVVIVTDTDPAAQTSWREKLRPRGFMLALIGKDGEVKLRKPLPWSVREITRSIDKMPMRQQEIRDRRAARP